MSIEAEADLLWDMWAEHVADVPRAGIRLAVEAAQASVDNAASTDLRDYIQTYVAGVSQVSCMLKDDILSWKVTAAATEDLPAQIIQPFDITDDLVVCDLMGDSKELANGMR
jgi:hypothetical protein